MRINYFFRKSILPSILENSPWQLLTYFETQGDYLSKMRLTLFECSLWNLINEIKFLSVLTYKAKDKPTIKYACFHLIGQKHQAVDQRSVGAVFTPIFFCLEIHCAHCAKNLISRQVRSGHHVTLCNRTSENQNPAKDTALVQLASSFLASISYIDTNINALTWIF